MPKKPRKMKIKLSKWLHKECKRGQHKFINAVTGESMLRNIAGCECCLGTKERVIHKRKIEDIVDRYYPWDVRKALGEKNISSTPWEMEAVCINDLAGEFGAINTPTPAVQRQKLAEHFMNCPEDEGGPIELIFEE